jgi:hypothetical protein
MVRCAIVACVAVLVLGFWANTTTAEEIGIQVSPSTINLAYEGVVVTVHAEIPLRGVVTASVKLNGVEVWYTKADARGDLVAKFHVDEVKEIIAPPSAELTLTGMVEVTPGVEVPFSGSDTVKVINQSGKK